ncbi:asparagine synthase (glutamine-hydrolyzing) [Thomasclavelia cocleata]|uniref:asparagine synthase (glutamine-hydrolyzing) n=1 Tax=Thomasclavelia cocleata TaxID=69824 RepID=UPI00242C2563|nr:asparagine synthase (glutamine-hydrolyzing) [Thomasclavelia cocleata]
MCGILGYTNCITNNQNVIENMLKKITHRGPDDQGYYQDNHISLGMRRLSIIDLNCGKQPIFNEDKSLILVFNGEIYNYQNLKNKLLSLGHIFTTNSDSEVIIHGYEEYGNNVVNHLRGMFAFAIYNLHTNSLYIARDIFGIKPLFYTIVNKQLIFASEIKALFEYPGIEKIFNEDCLASYLAFQYNPLTETFYKGIFQLLPAHYLEFNDTLKLTHYFKLKYNINSHLSENKAIRLIETTMKDSIDKHQLADVEMGAFLSGGIDSSYLAANSQVKKTFSIGFENPQCNELPLVKEFSQQLKIENYQKTITKEEFWQSVPTILKILDEPVADPSIIPLYHLSKLASQHVKVVLSGEGADELFGGYNIYQTPLTLAPTKIIPFYIRKKIKNILLKSNYNFKGKQYLIRAGQTVEERFIGNAFIFQNNELNKLIKPQHHIYQPQILTNPYYREVAQYDDITKMQYIDLNFWLRGDILRKADHISMANSLEVRVPYLDKEVWLMSSTLPTRLRVNKKATKYIFRKTAAKSLPPKNTKRKKLGFPVPINEWLKEEQYYQQIKELFNGPIAQKYFNCDYLNELLDNHFQNIHNNARKIWTVYIFIIWYHYNFN